MIPSDKISVAFSTLPNPFHYTRLADVREMPIYTRVHDGVQLRGSGRQPKPKKGKAMKPVLGPGGSWYIQGTFEKLIDNRVVKGIVEYWQEVPKDGWIGREMIHLAKRFDNEAQASAYLKKHEKRLDPDTN